MIHLLFFPADPVEDALERGPGLESPVRTHGRPVSTPQDFPALGSNRSSGHIERGTGCRIGDIFKPESVAAQGFLGNLIRSRQKVPEQRLVRVESSAESEVQIDPGIQDAASYRQQLAFRLQAASLRLQYRY